MPASVAGCSRRARGFHRSTILRPERAGDGARRRRPGPRASRGAWSSGMRARRTPSAQVEKAKIRHRGRPSPGCRQAVRACDQRHGFPL